MTCKYMGRQLPDYTEPELHTWAIANGLERLWEKWVASGYIKMLAPSVDRLDNHKSYTLSNIQLVTWETNLHNQKRQNKNGEYLHTKSKAIQQLTLSGELIQTFPSIGIAIRTLVANRTSASNITGACTGRFQTAYGFRWQFVS